MLRLKKHSCLPKFFNTILQNAFSTTGFMEHQKKNEAFYKDCTAYFEALRNKGKSDDSFEDEFFYTIPAISGSPHTH